MKIKQGMAGSRNGRSRWEPTAVLKEESKGKRRAEGKEEIKQQTAAHRIMRSGDQDRND